MKSYFDEAEFYANENYSNASGWSSFDQYDYFDEYNYAGGGSSSSNTNPAAPLLNSLIFKKNCVASWYANRQAMCCVSKVHGCLQIMKTT